MQETLLNIVAKANGYLADYILIILLIGAGLLFSFKTGFVQIRCFGEGMKKVFGNIKLFGGKQQGGGLSSFQALATAIAAQVGTGNIVGASGAILVGGPGAIFWMWIIAFLGMATIYAEAVLAQKTREKDENGEIQGGPVYYIKKAFPNKFGKVLAIFFAIAITLALGFMGSMVQSNSIAESCNTAFGIPTWVIGIIISAICAIIFIGGIQRIASVTEKLVPVMAVLFLAGGLVILCINFKAIPETFGMIFKYAFTPGALIGGGVGYAIKTAISQGAKRGLFSNEAGMGSTPHAHAQANVKRAHDQGVVAMIGVFIDTFIVLTMTALVVISTLYVGNGPLGDKYKAQAEAISVMEESEVNEAYDAYVLDSKKSEMVGYVNGIKDENIGAVYDKYALAEVESEVVTDAESEVATEGEAIDDTTEDVTALTAEDKKNELVGRIEALDSAQIEEAYGEYSKETGNSFEYAESIDDKKSALVATEYTKAMGNVSKTNAMQTAYTTALSALGNFGSIFVAICLLFFAFSTIISWNFFGKINVQYLFKNKKSATIIYSAIAIVFIFLGTLASNNLVWELTDFFNYLMVIPNVIALVALSKVVGQEAKDAIKANKELKK